MCAKRWRVHPAIRREDPERGHERTHRDSAGCEEVHAATDAIGAEQHDAEERRLEKKRGHDLVAEQRPDHVGRCARELAPVRAELEAHHEPRDDTEAERDGENFEPEAVEALIGRLARS